MPSRRVTDRHYLKQEQYRNAGNLKARIQLHVQFSTNPVGFHRWVFGHLGCPGEARLLELGCGPGQLWQENLEGIAPGWRVVLTDLSAGMVKTSAAMLRGRTGFRYAVMDAADIGFPAETFDAIIANHMLYHLPKPDRALVQIARVLKPTGYLISSTNGSDHLKELRQLIDEFDPDPQRVSGQQFEWAQLSDGYSLELGRDLLASRFGRVVRYTYPDALEVTEIDPIVDFVASSTIFRFPESDLPAFRSFVATRLAAADGKFKIRKETGLFIASEPLLQASN